MCAVIYVLDVTEVWDKFSDLWSIHNLFFLPYRNYFQTCHYSMISETFKKKKKVRGKWPSCHDMKKKKSMLQVEWLHVCISQDFASVMGFQNQYMFSALDLLKL